MQTRLHIYDRHNPLDEHGLDEDEYGISVYLIHDLLLGTEKLRESHILDIQEALLEVNTIDEIQIPMAWLRDHVGQQVEVFVTTSAPSFQDQ